MPYVHSYHSWYACLPSQGGVVCYVRKPTFLIMADWLKSFQFREELNIFFFFLFQSTELFWQNYTYAFLANVYHIKIRTKDSSSTLLSLVQFFMKPDISFIPESRVVFLLYQSWHNGKPLFIFITDLDYEKNEVLKHEP